MGDENYFNKLISIIQLSGKILIKVNWSEFYKIKMGEAKHVLFILILFASTLIIEKYIVKYIINICI